MKKILKTILVTIALMLSIVATSFAQTTTFDANYLIIKYTNGAWSEWQALTPNVTITVNETAIVILSQNTQIFTFGPDLQYTAANGDVLNGSRCTDIRGVYCNVYIVDKYNSDEFHLLIEYSDMQYAYNLINGKVIKEASSY